MDNLEKLATFGTQDTGRRQIKQNKRRVAEIWRNKRKMGQSGYNRTKTKEQKIKQKELLNTRNIYDIDNIYFLCRSFKVINSPVIYCLLASSWLHLPVTIAVWLPLLRVMRQILFFWPLCCLSFSWLPLWYLQTLPNCLFQILFLS